MTGHTAWRDIREGLRPERRARMDALKQEMLQQMELHQLREMAAISQVEMAKRLKTAQGAISRLERRPDVKLSTLRDYVRAIGGELEVRAIFKDRAIVLSHLAARRKGRRSRR